MAKRFVDTRMGRDPWFRRLKPKMKCAFRFLCDECDAAGVWAIDMEAMSFYIGEDVSLEELFPAINSDKNNRIEVINDTYIYITGFINFQYGSLSENSPAHKPILYLILKHNLSNRIFNRVSNTLKEMDKEEEKEMDKEMEEEGESSRGDSDNPLTKVLPLNPIGKNDKVTNEMRAIYKEYFPDDPENIQADHRSCRLIAVYLNGIFKWKTNEYETTKCQELLNYWRQLVFYASLDSFYRKIELARLEGHIGGLNKSYKADLKNRNNVNGKHTTNISKSIGKEFKPGGAVL